MILIWLIFPNIQLMIKAAFNGKKYQIRSSIYLRFTKKNVKMHYCAAIGG